MKFFFHIFFICVSLFSFAQPTILDPCFTSGTPGTSFASVANLADVGSNADLCVWNGTAWTGGWPGASLTKVPPVNSAGCRAIWCGSGTAWTTGGEGFGVKLSAPLVTGVAYSFSVTYVSHGTGSTGSFNPKVYTNLTGALAGAYLIGNMPAVGTNWTTNNLNFTATAAQNGHLWLIFGTWSNLSSGFINSFCSTCNTVVLPIELIRFDATLLETKEVLCEWATATEKNNKQFIVQRSGDALNFSDIKNIEGAGNSSSQIIYSYLDKYPIKEASYYRLKMIADNGEETYSDIKSVNFIDFINSTLYPNPTNGIINLPTRQNDLSFTNANSEIEILNYLGEIVLTVPYSNTIDVSIIESGYYTLKIKNPEEQSYSYKFIKK